MWLGSEDLESGSDGFVLTVLGTSGGRRCIGARCWFDWNFGGVGVRIPELKMVVEGLDAMASLMVWLMAMVVVEVIMVPAVAQMSPLVSPSPNVQPITCSLPRNVMISTNFCNAYDEQGMGRQTQSCQGFLTNFEVAPSADCCKGLNSVAYNRTACICKFTFYPPAAHNLSRQLDLPRLCGVLTDLCTQCPIFLTSLSNGSTSPSSGISNLSYSDGDSTASTVGAISLAVVFGLLLVMGSLFGVHFLIKKHKARNNPPKNFEPPPPGGVF